MRSLQGTVRNESGRPVEQAQVLLDPGKATREVRTDADGQFRFLGVAPGAHVLRVLRIGFAPHEQNVDVSSASASVSINLTRLTTLAEVTVTALPTGVYGTVLARDSLDPLAGARVSLLGARQEDTTAADGSFSMPGAEPGTYMLRVTRDGYDTRLLSVRVPRDTGVGVDLVLRPGSPLLDAHMEGLWFDMAQRINWKGVNAAVVAREELLDRGPDLALALKFAPSAARKGLVVDDRACLFVDGVARPYATVKDFDAGQIESIEVYGSRSETSNTLAPKWPARVPCGNPVARVAPGNRALYVSIWLRR